MRLNYDTFTGRRSVFVLVAFLLILLFWAANAVFWTKFTVDPAMSKTRLLALQLLVQNGLVVLAVLVAALVAERDRSMKEKFGLAIAPEYSLQFLFPVFVLTILATYGSQYGLTHLLKAFGHEPKPQSLVDFFRTLKPQAFIGFAAITVIAAPIAEELAFRHILYRTVRIVLYRREAAVLVSLVFAVFHVSLGTLLNTKPFPWEMLVVPVVPLFILAMFFQWQYERSKSIIPSMLMHAGFNLISVFLLALQVAYGKPEEKPTADPVSGEPVVEAPAETPAEAPAESPAEAAELPAEAAELPAEAPAPDNGSAPAAVPANDGSAPMAEPANDGSAPMAVPVAVPVEAVVFTGF